ncbi:MAG: four helix bundle protein [Rickettsiales bacterium]|jgi:four helix bundle protein|nr:four helix bundle protein [Rickettsiales bacterium]
MSILKEKSGKFADRIMLLHGYLHTTKKEFVVSKQIVRSGTSIGANISEANRASSLKDFVSKMNIAAKECSETEYWLERLKGSRYITNEQFDSIHNDCLELGKMLTSTIKTATAKLYKKKELTTIN